MRRVIYIWMLIVAICASGCAIEEPLNEGDNDTTEWVDGDVITIQQASGNDGLDVIIIGDGFTESHMIKEGIYEQIMRQAAAHIVSIEPVKSYAEHLNIYAIVAVSEQSGISAESEDDATETALGCYYGDGTTIGGDHSTIQRYTYNIEGFSYSDLCNSVICVVLNDNKHAGTTYFFMNSLLTIAYCPFEGYDNTLFGQLVHHEVVGHGIGRLLDEYIYYDSYIDSATLEELETAIASGKGKNLSTSATEPSWSYLFDIDGYDEVGIYEGGYFYTKGVYRPEYVSCMEDNRAYFNAPSRQAIVERIFDECDEEFSFDSFIANDLATQPTAIPEPIIATTRSSGETANAHLHPPITLDVMPLDLTPRAE